MLEKFIRCPNLLTGVGRDDHVEAAEMFNVGCMEFKKMMSMILIMPGIVYL